MIYLGLWLLVLGVSAAQPDSTHQQTQGGCSPNVAYTGGNVSITMNCPGVDPKALEALNRDMRFTKEELRSIRELLQQARVTPDTQVGQQAEALVREGKLQEANTLLGRELDLTKGQLRRTIKQLEQKTRKADEWARAYNDLLQQARATRDTQVRQQAETLVRRGRLQEADGLLNPPVISMAQYHAIQPGMSYQEVVRILGRPGVEQGRSPQSQSYLWQNMAGMGLVVVVFIDGRAHSIAQSGLPE
jgi:hypothetical protein